MQDNNPRTDEGKLEVKQGTTIEYWTVVMEGHPSGHVSTHRAVYYEDAEHKDVKGSHGERGAPWHQQWALYEKTAQGWRLTGRVDGDIISWFKALNDNRLPTVFFNEREAKQAWKAICQRNVERLASELTPWRAALERAEVALT